MDFGLLRDDVAEWPTDVVAATLIAKKVARHLHEDEGCERASPACLVARLAEEPFGILSGKMR